MTNESWAANVVYVSECYTEKYPSGKKNYEMVEFGPVTENCFVYLPEGITQKQKDILIMDRRTEIHDRLVRSVIDMVNKAVEQGRIVGVNKR